MASYSIGDNTLIITSAGVYYKDQPATFNPTDFSKYGEPIHLREYIIFTDGSKILAAIQSKNLTNINNLLPCSFISNGYVFLQDHAAWLDIFNINDSRQYAQIRTRFIAGAQITNEVCHVDGSKPRCPLHDSTKLYIKATFKNGATYHQFDFKGGCFTPVEARTRQLEDGTYSHRNTELQSFTFKLPIDKIERPSYSYYYTTNLLDGSNIIVVQVTSGELHVCTLPDNATIIDTCSEYLIISATNYTQIINTDDSYTTREYYNGSIQQYQFTNPTNGEPHNVVMYRDHYGSFYHFLDNRGYQVSTLAFEGIELVNGTIRVHINKELGLYHTIDFNPSD